ncbi:hypothetical protein CASP1_00069 [Alcaligenes phage CASP1]|nr:hypothetical protein CASP1_00069 [Alcaligenes phage CASP1]
MAKVIQNFLVGVGLDTRDFDKGAKDVVGGLGKIRTATGFAGTAMIGAFATASASAITAANRIDKLVLSTEKFDTSSQFIYTYGNALRALGGDAGEAVTAIRAAESALDELRLKGSFSAFEDSVFAGVDTSRLVTSRTGEDFLRNLSDMLPELNAAQQRLVQESFGFSDATMRSLRDGTKAFDMMLARSAELGGSIDGAANAAREFNKELAELGTRMDAVGNTLAEKMIPSFNGILKSVNNFLDSNKENISTVADVASRSPGGTAAFVGGSAALAGAAGLSAVGLGGGAIGGALSTAGPLGIVAGGGLIAAQATPDEVESLTGWRPSDYLFENNPGDLIRDTFNWMRDRPSGFDFYKDGRSTAPKKPGQPRFMSQSDLNAASSPAEYADISPPVTYVEAARDSQIDLGEALSQRDKRPIRVDNQIDLNVKLNGRQFEAEVTDIIDRRELSDFESLQSTTRF